MTMSLLVCVTCLMMSASALVCRGHFDVSTQARTGLNATLTVTDLLCSLVRRRFVAAAAAAS